MLDSFIALDLETTGLRPEADEIIEVGAVRFRDGLPVEEFHTLVNPRRPIPEAIQRLTGISPHELAKAPGFERVAAAVTSFLDSAPLVGHNLAFDLSFLAAQGVRPDGLVFDTYHLACLLFPQSQGYSLASIAGQSGLTLPAEHRALIHAKASGLVFLELQNNIKSLHHSIQAEISRIGKMAGATWHSLFQQASELSPSLQSVDTRLPLLARLPELEIEPLVPKANLSSLIIESLVGLLEPGGALQSALSGFEHRPEQVQMSRAVAEALNQGQQLIVEAGTGTGKSMAYLLPAMSFALDNQVRIVLSTNTINLQEQLVNKDIPQLKEALDNFRGLKTAILKGRANYLCLLCWDLLRQSLVLSPEEALFLCRILVWLGQTTTGDKAELRLLAQEASLWNRVAASEENCHKGACHYFKEGRCFLFRARQQAESAHLIVTNHALLLSEVASGAQILPDYNHLIIDEAHHLEAEATEQLGIRITSEQLEGHLNHIGQKRLQSRLSRDTGLLAEIEASLRQVRLVSSRLNDVETLMAQCRQDLEAARYCSSQFFRALLQFIDSRNISPPSYERRLRLTSSVRAQPGWSNIEVVGENLVLSLQQLGLILGKLHSALEDTEQVYKHHPGITDRLASSIVNNSQLAQQLRDTLFNVEKGRVYWAIVGDNEERASLCSAPLQVGETLDKGLYSRKKCLVLTSATLSIQGHLHFARERLGLNSARELVLGSPFDYKASALIYILENIPTPDQPGYQGAVGEAVAALAQAAGGRTLCLFTSYASLRATLETIRPHLEAQDIQVLGQGIDGSPQQILNAFKSIPRAVLLGTSSFWEGIDVPGDALSLIIIPRLPFPVPTDPIFEARCEMMDDGFNGYAVPQAILRLKQGFGRLIRRRSDRGALVLLDRRIKIMKYGRVFLESLPPCTIKSGALRQMVQEISAWIGSGH